MPRRAGGLKEKSAGDQGREQARLAGFLPEVDITTSTDHGVDADAKEAIAFAVLAHEKWRRKPSNLPSATGAKRAVLLGSITP